MGQSKDFTPEYDVAPNVTVQADTAPSANFTYPKLFGWHYSTIAPQNGGTVGAMFFNNQYYLNAWNSTSLYLYDGGLAGPQNLLNTLTYQGAIRDLATDGTWLYGSPANTTIHRMDANGISQGTITSAGGNARALAYSEDENAFFVCDFSTNIGVINATTGALIRTLTGTSTLAAKYGMAYTTAAQLAGGPYLWVWGQGSLADPFNKLWKISPTDGTVIDTYQFGPLPPGATSPLGIAGGAAVVQIADRWVLLLNYQNFELQGYDLGEATIIGPGQATDPIPTAGATGVAITGVNLSWTNPAGATTNEVFFGTDIGSLTSIHSGSLVSSVNAPSPLEYNTTYYWRVDETDGTGTTQGAVWSFTTMENPNLIVIFLDQFESGLGNWTVTNNGGTCDWQIFMPTYPNAYTLPPSAGGGILAADSDECGNGTTLLSSVTTTIDATQYENLELDFDSDFRILDADDHCYVEVSTDGGTNWNIVWSVLGVDLRNTHEIADMSAYDGTNFQLRFRSVQPGWDWWWAVDNVRLRGTLIIPVELTSFAASVIDGKVNLNWATASETNNYGFEVERKSAGQEFAKVGFVAGYGTTTETKNYSYVDNSVSAGNYTYRLRQVDFDGTFEYSSEVEVDLSPSSYSLSQNYPNPFNPATIISFSLASDSKVTLKIFDVLGQEVTTLVNGDLSAGIHNLNFDASSINSGVYFYTIEAKGVDGSNFTSTKKMILTK